MSSANTHQPTHGRWAWERPSLVHPLPPVPSLKHLRVPGVPPSFPITVCETSPVHGHITHIVLASRSTLFAFSTKSLRTERPFAWINRQSTKEGETCAQQRNGPHARHQSLDKASEVRWPEMCKETAGTLHVMGSTASGKTTEFENAR